MSLFLLRYDEAKFFPSCLQLDAMDCGPSCLRMVAKYYGKTYSCKPSVHVLLLPVKEFPCWASVMRRNPSVSVLRGIRISLEQLKEDVPLPCILHWNQNHFVVCYDIKKKRSGYRFYIADPARQLISYSEEEFKSVGCLLR